MRHARLVAATVFALWALGACGSCGASSTGAASPSGPTQAQLASARIQGAWVLTVTLDSYSGPAPGAAFRQPGPQGLDQVVFVSTCPAPGACTLQLWGSSGPDPAQADYYTFYSHVTGLEGPPVSTPMTQSGATYTQAFPTGGYGGASCSPSTTVPRPEQRLTLTVTNAAAGTSGWTATAVTGTETFLAGWGCSAAIFTGWRVAHLTISGKPA